MKPARYIAGRQLFYFDFLRECRDAHLGKRLTMTLFLGVAALLAVAHDDDFRCAAILDELGCDLGTLDVRSTHIHLGTVVCQKHFVESDFIPRLIGTLDQFHIQDAVVGDDILLPACFYDSYLGHTWAKL